MNITFTPAALELIKEAIAKAGYTNEVVIGMDVAASEFYRDGKYDLDFKSPDDPTRYITPDELADLYKSFVKDYPGNLQDSFSFTYSAQWEQEAQYSHHVIRKVITQSNEVKGSGCSLSEVPLFASVNSSFQNDYTMKKYWHPNQVLTTGVLDSTSESNCEFLQELKI